MAWGDVKGTLTGGATSIPAGGAMAASGSVSIAAGDLIVAMVAEVGANTVTGVTDNLGNNYSAPNAGSLSSVGGRAFYSVAAAAGTLTAVTGQGTASANDFAIAAAVFTGPFTPAPLDTSPANTTDATSPFTGPATGTLGKPLEIVVSCFASTRGYNDFLATSPNVTRVQAMSGTLGAANSCSAAIGSQTTAATTTVTPAWTRSSGTFTGGVETTMSFTSLQTLAPSARYSDADTFFAQLVSAAQALTPSRYDDPDSFQIPTVALPPGGFVSALILGRSRGGFASTSSFVPGGFRSFRQWLSVSANALATGELVQAATYQDADSFPAALVKFGPLLPALFAGVNNFPSATLGLYLTPTLLSDPDSFQPITLVLGTIALGAQGFTNANSFGAAAVSFGPLLPPLFSDADSFPSSSVAVGPVGLSAALFADADLFPAPHVATGSLVLLPPQLVNANVFGAPIVTSAGTLLGPALFDDPDVFSIPALSVGPVGLIASLYSDPDAFPSPRIALGLAGTLYSDVDAFPLSPSVSASYSLLAAFYGDPDAFLTPALAFKLSGGFYSDADTFFSPIVSSGVLLVAPSRFDDADQFPGGALGVGPIFLIPAARHSDADLFPVATVAQSAARLFPTRYDDPDTFGQPFVDRVTANDLFVAFFFSPPSFLTPTVLRFQPGQMQWNANEFNPYMLRSGGGLAVTRVQKSPASLAWLTPRRDDDADQFFQQRVGGIQADLSLTVTPLAATWPSTTPLGTIVATLQGVWSNGDPFVGSYIFVAPNYDGTDNPPNGISVVFSLEFITSTGPWAILVNPDHSGSLIVNPNGPGLAGLGGVTDHITIEAFFDVAPVNVSVAFFADVDRFFVTTVTQSAARLSPTLLVDVDRFFVQDAEAIGITITPATPSWPSTTPTGTTVATLQGTWSAGRGFTGTYQFASPNYDGTGSPPSGTSVASTLGGITSTGPYAIVRNADGSGSLVINPLGPGVGGASGTTAHVTVRATE